MNNFMIAPIGQGIRKDLKPFATPEDSFQQLLNAYLFRGRIVRRPGYTSLGRLANGTPVMGLRTREEFGIDQQQLIAFDTTASYLWNGTAFVALPSVMPVTWSGTDYQFFWTTNYAGGFWATNSKPGLNGVAVVNAVPGVGITTITTATPHGFTTGQTVVLINLGGMNDLNGNSYVITVTGASTFTIPFASVGVYTANGIALNAYTTQAGQDGIRYYGDLTNGAGWANYNPPIDPNNALAGALMIFAYRGCLVFLNTTEGNDQGTFNYGNRARWTQVGTPYYSPPVPISPSPQTIDINTARDDLFGRGGAEDAPTNEVIVTAEFVRDILVVYFERSTWRLRFVNNAQNPFVWERINRELGAESTFSGITFDKGLMSVGTRGIPISDSNDTVRFDEKIPDDVFTIRQNNHGFDRIYGIRTFRTRLCYWTFPSGDNPTGIYPDQVLVFNYDTKDWAFFDDCFTCFGYYYPSQVGYTWGDLTKPWPDYNNQSSADGVTQEGFETIIAGNQQGFVFKLEQTSAQNDPSLAISAITLSGVGTSTIITSNDYNLPDGTWIKLSGITGTTFADGVSLNNRNFKISQIFDPITGDLDQNNFSINEFESLSGGNASGSSYSFLVEFFPILPGGVQINIGSLIFTDPYANGLLVSTTDASTGTVDYNSGLITITFAAPIGSTPVIIRLVSVSPEQDIVPVQTIGAYGGGGLIAKISNIDIQTKIFNFFKEDQRARLSRIDFYTDLTTNGQFTCNVWADSSNVPVNTPLPDNPQSNVVLTSPNAYQVPGTENLFRLYCDAIAQTIQCQFTLSDAQMAVDAINSEDIDLLAFIYGMRPGGRLL